MSQREADKRETRRRILDAAREQFEEHGFASASIRGIAKLAGVATGTVLLHFNDKSSLLHAALHEDLEDAIAEGLAAPDGPLVESVCAIFRPCFAYYERRPRLSRTLLKESLFADSPWKERFGEQAMRVNARICELIRWSQAAGELSQRASPEHLATALIALYYLILIGWAQGLVSNPMGQFSELVEAQVSPHSEVS